MQSYQTIWQCTDDEMCETVTFSFLAFVMSSLENVTMKCVSFIRKCEIHKC